jgi:hypothetical protein
MIDYTYLLLRLLLLPMIDFLLHHLLEQLKLLPEMKGS